MMTIGETLVKEEIYKSFGVPSLILDVDSSDWRSYNETQTKESLEIFLQIMDRK